MTLTTPVKDNFPNQAVCGSFRYSGCYVYCTCCLFEAVCGRRVETWNITSVSLNPVYTLYSPVVSAAGGRGVWGIRGKGEGKVGRERMEGWIGDTGMSFKEGRS